MTEAKNDKNALLALYRVNKIYGIGAIVFFALLVVFPISFNANLSPLFRNWEVYRDPVNVRPVYINWEIQFNDSVRLGDMHLNNSTTNVVMGQLHAYMNLRKNGDDGLYVMESGTLARLFPQYRERQHNQLSDTATFRKKYLSNLSNILQFPVRSMSILEQAITYDSVGYAHKQSEKKILEFRNIEP